MLLYHKANKIGYLTVSYIESWAGGPLESALGFKRRAAIGRVTKNPFLVGANYEASRTADSHSINRFLESVLYNMVTGPEVVHSSRPF